MNSEPITRNDLAAILNEVLPPTPSEYKKLLWTNPNLSANFNAQTISLDLADYDDVEILLMPKPCGTDIEATTSSILRVGNTKTAWIYSPIYTEDGSGGSWIGMRAVKVTSTGCTFGNGGYYYMNQASWNSNSAAHGVPYQIYGIKYNRVAPPQVEEWEEIPISYIVTTGDDGDSNFMLKAYKNGDLLQWRMQGLNRAAATSAGANMWGATITGLPSSFIDVMGSSYYNTSHIDVYFQCTGATTATITARVTGAQLSANCVVNGISAMTRFI